MVGFTFETRLIQNFFAVILSMATGIFMVAASGCTSAPPPPRTLNTSRSPVPAQLVYVRLLKPSPGALNQLVVEIQTKALANNPQIIYQSTSSPFEPGRAQLIQRLKELGYSALSQVPLLLSRLPESEQLPQGKRKALEFSVALSLKHSLHIVLAQALESRTLAGRISLLKYLSQRRQKLGPNQMVLALGGFGISAEDDNAQHLYERFAQTHWLVVHQLGEPRTTHMTSDTALIGKEFYDGALGWQILGSTVMAQDEGLTFALAPTADR